MYARWVSTHCVVDVGSISIPSQQIEASEKEVKTGLDVERLRSAGCSYLSIKISGGCSDYDYKMNDRGRYFVFKDVKNGDLVSWTFKVDGFSGVG